MYHTITLCRINQISVPHTPDLAKSVALTLRNRRSDSDMEDNEFTAALNGDEPYATERLRERVPPTRPLD